MADRAIMPVALDSNGDIVAAAQAYFYERGTLTPLTVYEDEAGSVPHASPVVADAAGVFPPVFVVDGYKVDIQDTLSASLPGYPSDPGYTSPEGATGATSVTFTPITGNAATNVQAAIQTLTTLWNAVTTYGRQLGATADAAAARTLLGLTSGAVATAASQAEAEAGTENTKYMTALRVEQARANDRFTSAAQTITSGGLLTIAHGLGAAPRMVQLRLVCTSAEYNYSIGDNILTDIHHNSAATDRTNSLVVNATNILLRMSPATQVFVYGDKSTGAIVALTNASWQLHLEAML